MKREKIEKIIKDGGFLNLAYEHVFQSGEYKQYNFEDINVILDTSCLKIEKENCCGICFRYENIDLFIININKDKNSLLIQVINLDGINTTIFTCL